jgi:chromosomal replication initiation ATPase DnaA
MKTPCDNLAGPAPRPEMKRADARIRAARIEIRAFLDDLKVEMDKRLDKLQQQIWREELSLRVSITRATTDHLEAIIKMVALAFDLPEAAFFSRTHREIIVVPRHVVMYLARRNTACTLDDIGGHLEKDHGTVLYGVRATEDRMSANPVFKEKIVGLEKHLRNAATWSLPPLPLN